MSARPTSRPSGLPAADQPLPQGAAKVAAVRALFDTIAPRYDFVNRVMTFGMDRGWRRATVRSLSLVPGSVVVDLACGTGDLCRDLVRAGYRAVGVDLSFGMLAHARTPSPLVQGDALALPLPDQSVGGVVSGFGLRNFVELPPVFAELARIVRPGGRIALLDVAQPEQAVLRAGHAVYFGHVAPFIGGLLSDKTAYRYLPRSLAYLPPAPTVLAQLTAAGFAQAERRLLSGGITQLYTA
ncbi:MAG: ubiquinone/menaquinone biosynthesis methyltransferase, partial [Actinomycetota bacterium]|nr:ubiquinone/menaquinone biosynthesis methyltransferase [Actinomycetota bacterium]